ncbi:MAG: thioether cross-link-forming SCIFF peptide maturase [Clostridiaceae bacterium]|nr:thioether cross-link-forming SCIFF peptide maturase [Clostridiaceae bacterium]
MIHQFRVHNTNIVLDVNSGAVHILDDIASEVLSCFDENGRPIEKELGIIRQKYGEVPVTEALSELETLKSEGLLFSSDPFEDIFSAETTPAVVKALCLHMAHDCNLRCKYCFAGEGNYHSEKSKMPFEVAKKAIDFVIESSGNRRNIEIDFFGGEPLLNLKVIKDTVLYAREKEKSHNKRFRFTITTNGLLLDDETMEYINNTMDNIVLSLDGRREINDAMRIRRDGSGCYEAIVPKFQKMVSIRKDKDYYIRGTFTGNNLDFSEDVLHMAELGFEQLSIEPVVLPDGSGIEIKREHLEIICSEYEKLALKLLKLRKQGKRVNFFHFMLDLEGGPCVAKRLRGCGSGTEYLAVTPQGDLYPCHQFAGIEEFKLGNVFTGIDKQDVVESFRGLNVYTKKSCRDCWAKFYCSGGCAANAWHFQKDLSGNYEIGCELEKKRVECALWLKAQELLG